MDLQVLFNFTYGWENLTSPWRTVLVVVYLLVGLVLLVYGGDWFVDGSVWFAEKFKIPKLIIGATVVSMCTTMPEFLVSTFASIEGASFMRAGETALAISSVDMATGNAMGSVICNTGLILALSMLFRPMEVDKKTFFHQTFDANFCLSRCSGFLVIDRKFQFWDGILMLLILVAFLVDNVVEAKRQMALESSLGREMGQQKKMSNFHLKKPEEKDSEKTQKEEIKTAEKHSTAYYVSLFILGVVAIIVGAQLLVDNGTEFATEMGVSNKNYCRYHRGDRHFFAGVDYSYYRYYQKAVRSQRRKHHRGQHYRPMPDSFRRFFYLPERFAGLRFDHVSGFAFRLGNHVNRCRADFVNSEVEKMARNYLSKSLSDLFSPLLHLFLTDFYRAGFVHLPRFVILVFFMAYTTSFRQRRCYH
jgi:Ca2+/Na+ antiporter